MSIILYIKYKLLQDLDHKTLDYLEIHYLFVDGRRHCVCMCLASGNCLQIANETGPLWIFIGGFMQTIHSNIFSKLICVCRLMFTLNMRIVHSFHMFVISFNGKGIGILCSATSCTNCSKREIWNPRLLPALSMLFFLSELKGLVLLLSAALSLASHL